MGNLSSDKDLPRLTRAALGHFPATVSVPEFDVTALTPGILHIGCGSFHRAHQAALTQEAINLTGKQGLVWGIDSICVMNKNVYDALREQDNLYTILQCEPHKTRAQIVGTLTHVLYPPADHIGAHRRIAQENIRIVTFTVTPGGYSVLPETGRLDEHDPKIQQDLAGIKDPTYVPQTTIGIVAAGLALIKHHGGTPPVMLSCDNATSNGITLKNAVVDFAHLYDASLARWIHNNVQFPCSVVDRIAQPETEETLALAAELTGYRDTVPVPTEAVWHWTIENFDGPRPAWAEIGARFVADIRPYEVGKLRLLNASHMLLAYVGGLFGFTTIAQGMSQPQIRALVHQFMVSESGATVGLSQAQLEQTAQKVMARFANSAIEQQIVRIGRNGSEKMIPRVTDALRENIAAGRPTPATIVLIAAWIYSFLLISEGKYPGELIEPKSAELTQLARSNSSSGRALADAFLARTDIFGDIPDPRIKRDIAQALDGFMRGDLIGVLQEHIQPEFAHDTQP